MNTTTTYFKFSKIITNTIFNVSRPVPGGAGWGEHIVPDDSFEYGVWRDLWEDHECAEANSEENGNGLHHFHDKVYLDLDCSNSLRQLRELEL